MTGTLASGVRVRSVKVLDRFANDHALRTYGASASRSARTTPSSGVRISWTRARHGNLIHEKERLEVSPYTVLPPPEIEDGAKPLEGDTAEAPRERRRVAARGR